jgi:hypothetical protein
MSTSDRPPERYRICIRGLLDSSWSEWFDGLTVTPEADGTTTLTGQIVDQAALYGVLGRLRDLGATLVTVEQLAAGHSAADDQRPHHDADHPGMG